MKKRIVYRESVTNNKSKVIIAVLVFLLVLLLAFLLIFVYLSYRDSGKNSQDENSNYLNTLSNKLPLKWLFGEGNPIVNFNSNAIESPLQQNYSFFINMIIIVAIVVFVVLVAILFFRSRNKR